MTEDVETIRQWCAASDLACRDDEEGGLLLRIGDADLSEVRAVGGRDGEPLRLHDSVALEARGLSPEHLADVVEDVVLRRSSLVDARPTADGQGAEVVVVVHAEGLNRHTFVEATFEVQKVRLLLQREVAAAVAANRTLSALESLAGQGWAASSTPSA